MSAAAPSFTPPGRPTSRMRPSYTAGQRNLRDAACAVLCVRVQAIPRSNFCAASANAGSTPRSSYAVAPNTFEPNGMSMCLCWRHCSPPTSTVPLPTRMSRPGSSSSTQKISVMSANTHPDNSSHVLSLASICVLSEADLELLVLLLGIRRQTAAEIDTIQLHGAALR
ncbi:hypothetical protein V7S43_002349 [Phytophthora oleae]|uniref:Uncharacterized protein n=1 Tax=Phytophthora oleae TaxID=2107226 RepID=A0ABD3G7D5_9STRA